MAKKYTEYSTEVQNWLKQIYSQGGVDSTMLGNASTYWNKSTGENISKEQISNYALGIYNQNVQDEARNVLLAQQVSNPGRTQTTQTKRRNYLNTSNSSQFLTNAATPQRSLLNLGQ